MNLRRFRWLIAIAVCLGPLVELTWAYLKVAEGNWASWALFKVFVSELHSRHLVISSLLIFTGWSVVAERSWARRAGLMVILSITFGHVFLLSFSKRFQIAELLPGIIANIFIAFYLYREEFKEGLIGGLPNPQRSPSLASHGGLISIRVRRRVVFPALNLDGRIDEVDMRGIWIRWTQQPGSDFDPTREIVFRSGEKNISLVFDHHRGERSRFLYREAWIQAADVRASA